MLIKQKRHLDKININPILISRITVDSHSICVFRWLDLVLYSVFCIFIEFLINDLLKTV